MGIQTDYREELDPAAENVAGDIYLRFDEKAEEIFAAELEHTRRTRPNGIVLQEGVASPLDQVRAVLLQEGALRNFYVSNASTRPPRACRNSHCVMGDARESCVLARRSCSVVVLRPVCDTPSLQAMFPGDEIMGLKAWVWECPHRPQGAVLSVIGPVWLPKCDRRPYEVAVQGRVFLDNGGLTFSRRANNAFRAPLFERLEPMSMRTKEKLREWSEYIEWRSHLLMATKVGIRYIAARVDVQRRNLVFTAVAESRESFVRNRFWEHHEPVYACRLENSNDAWTYRERTFDECREQRIKKDYGIELGDFERTTPREDIRRSFAAASAECPWRSPYFADISFAVDGELVGKMEDELGRAASPDEVEDFLERHLKLPKSGFLTLSSVGDEVLISRQRRAIQNFGESGSNAAPFLSTYMFDITKARVPEKVEAPKVFLNGKLNDNQKNAVATILSAPDVALVQGPPGTGKTTVIAEALWQFAHAGKRVLMVSQSGAAVDNALDRLANIPEIRAIRLQKERRSADCQDEGSRYSKGNALANYYQTLGETARRRLAEWNSLSERRQAVGELLTRLVNVQDRLASEDRLVADSRASQESALAEVEKTSVPALHALEAIGLRVFDPAYNPNWSFDQKRQALRNARETVRAFESECCTRLRADVSRLEGLSGETVMSDEDALRVAEFRGRIAELQRRMDAEQDDAVFVSLSHEQRDVRRAMNACIAAAGFDAEPYCRYLTLPDERGRRWKDVLTDGHVGRTGLLRELTALRGRIEEAMSRLGDTGLRRLEGELLALDERIAEAQNRRSPFAEKAEADLAAARTELGVPEGTLSETVDWCEQEVRRVRDRLDETRGERALLGSLYQGWLGRLATPTDSDLERVLPEYMKNCSIVGVTCTSDTRILEQNGFDHFDVVLIDEVSKATPPELLMCMTLAEKAVLVGDHRQLPPLFGDREPLTMEEIMERDEEDGIEESRRVTRANFRKYERMVGASLFKEYFEQAPDAIKCTLWEQYRMHPDIMNIVNDFYDGHLTCGLKDADAVRDHLLGPASVPWMRGSGHAFWIDSTRDPYGIVFEEEQSGSSKVNRLEAALVVKALRDLDAGLEAHAKSNGGDVRKTVGVIAFYGHQKRLLRREVQKLELRHLTCRVDTVDRFQGQERDYVLVSMTRNKACHASGIRSANAYVAKFERINVAFSRARELLLVFGAADMFVDYEVSLPPLLQAGPAKFQPVYRRMIAGLNARGRLVGAGKMLPPGEWRAMSEKITWKSSPRKRKPAGR